MFHAFAKFLLTLSEEMIEVLFNPETWPSLKVFLAEHLKLMWRSITYDQSGGLMPLIKSAVGPNNERYINTDITQKRFPLMGTGVRTVKCRVEACLDGESSEKAATRLVAAGHILGNTGDLAGYLRAYPEEVEKWVWVLAISEDSRWSRPGGYVVVPYANVNGSNRNFDLYDFRDQLNSRNGILVRS